MIRLPTKNPPWTGAQVDEAKAQVRAELTQAFDRGGIGARLDGVLHGIRTYEEADGAQGQLLLYIYIVSALVHHERYGGITTAQINRFVNIAYAVLKYQGVQPETSKLGFLYGELHLALSQIHRRDGEHWSASWEQQMAAHLAKRNPPGGEAFQNLSIAIRALRLGHGARAQKAFAAAAASEGAATPGTAHFDKVRIGMIRCLRLSGQRDAAAGLIRETLALPGLAERVTLEVRWEDTCLAAATGDLSRMMAGVQRGGEHYEAVYLAEAFLWAHAVRELQWVQRLPKMQTLARKKDMRPGELGFFLKAALQIESCYDQHVPYTLRLKALGQILGKVNELVSIDRELLVQLAATRWLARQHATTLAATTLAEYQGTSLKLGVGRTSDALGVAGDLLGKDWFGGDVAA